jgi:hypothetical protein
MAIRFYLYVLIVFFAGTVIYFYDELNSSPEAAVILGIGFFLVAVALGFFVHNNRRSLNDLTTEPTEENVAIVIDLLFKKKRRANKQEK